MLAKKLLTVTAENKNVHYGDAVPALTYTMTGFAAGESQTSPYVIGQPALSTLYTVTTPVGSSPVTITAALGTLTSNNYSFAFVNGNVNIDKKDLAVTAVASNITYGDAAQQ